MKFRTAPFKFWRQRGDCCLFFEVLEVLHDDGDTAELKVAWCRQNDRSYRVLAVENTRIQKKDYINWVSYLPRGERFVYAS